MATYTHTVDAKGRIIVPAKIRERIDGALTVTRSLDGGYLSAYTREQFDDIVKQFSEGYSNEKRFRKFRRYIVGQASECDLDAQGRISIPAALWNAIGVENGDEVCFIDVMSTIEICSKKHYDEEQAELTCEDVLDFSDYEIRGL